MSALRLTLLLGLLKLSFSAASKSSGTLPCRADSIPKPEYFGTSVTNLQAQEVKGWGAYGMFGWLGAAPPKGSIDFCNVTVTYTHPGLNDTVNVYVWLPLEGWNERFIGVGGGGFAAGAEGRLGLRAMLDFHAHPHHRCPRARCPGWLRRCEHGRRPRLYLRPLQSLHRRLLGPRQPGRHRLDEPAELRLRRARRHGAPRQGRHGQLLRPSAPVRLLERLQHGWAAGHDAGPALPEELRRHPRHGAGVQHGRLHRGRVLAFCRDEAGGVLPAALRDDGPSAGGDRGVRRARWR